MFGFVYEGATYSLKPQVSLLNVQHIHFSCKNYAAAIAFRSAATINRYQLMKRYELAAIFYTINIQYNETALVE